MAKKQFKSESKRLLDLMIHSIYTHKEIFIRELISNASDAMDKMYYKALTTDKLDFNKDNYKIKIITNKEDRTFKIIDTGIGMTKEELDKNLGTIAKSGSLNFKEENDAQEGYDIIGQFGVGFYSSFMVADEVMVKSKAYGSEEAYCWTSKGADGYTLDICSKEDVGTEITLTIKENTEDENYDTYLNPYHLKSLVKKYSDFIRYPIIMEIPVSNLKEGSKDEFEESLEEQTVNSMVPIWRKNKNELKDEDYENFYSEKHYGFDKPIKHAHISVEGAIRYNAILFIPEKAPYDYYTKDYEKGLELYSNGVLIMHRAPELLPDHFSFVKGLVDSEDLSLNISREMLQHDRQLKLISKNIEKQIKKELLSLLKNNREAYDKFYESFGRQLKYGIYADYGMNKDLLSDLLLFYSSKDKKLVSLDEYIERMPDDQNFIYYATGESLEKIEKLPQTEQLLDRNYEILYLVDDIDEFAVKVLTNYREKEFRSVTSNDLGIEDLDNKEELEEEIEKNKDLFAKMKTILDDKVFDVRPSKRLKNHPVCFANDGDISIEMEKILNQMPNGQQVKADKVLEINIEHKVFDALKAALKDNEDDFALYTKVLYDQARLIEGLSIDDPVEFADNIWKLMK
ncbi:MAG: molecular chaperone HtpG [Firmicutes bacterium]|nr:molecular chaperone HtpG [Bacillota bacterium]